jgi:hypothetical protein
MFEWTILSLRDCSDAELRELLRMVCERIRVLPIRYKDDDTVGLYDLSEEAE